MKIKKTLSLVELIVFMCMCSIFLMVSSRTLLTAHTSTLHSQTFYNHARDRRLIYSFLNRLFIHSGIIDSPMVGLKDRICLLQHITYISVVPQMLESHIFLSGDNKLMYMAWGKHDNAPHNKVCHFRRVLLDNVSKIEFTYFSKGQALSEWTFSNINRGDVDREQLGMPDIVEMKVWMIGNDTPINYRFFVAQEFVFQAFHINKIRDYAFK